MGRVKGKNPRNGGTRNTSVVVTALHAQINLNKLKEINHGTIDYISCFGMGGGDPFWFMMEISTLLLRMAFLGRQPKINYNISINKINKGIVEVHVLSLMLLSGSSYSGSLKEGKGVFGMKFDPRSLSLPTYYLFLLSSSFLSNLERILQMITMKRFLVSVPMHYEQRKQRKVEELSHHVCILNSTIYIHTAILMNYATIFPSKNNLHF
ncbi:hypothetical protein NC653_030889 [Populus alba x Populus x berolinensis]|uniref:Uncharacterized protein n=1 Tax=Populus alba x Populus x berolinensis TaxID=444605 RepID=A0AAD6LX21_9ROSI|nr:hypothetical protein NC653_030889 [Populus alba x Populus x berolinensis]